MNCFNPRTDVVIELTVLSEEERIKELEISKKLEPIKKLFSDLMHDWNEQLRDHKKSYGLIEKFDKFKKDSKNNKTMFDELFDIIKDEDGKFYFRICLKIMYYYFQELIESEKLTIDPKIIIEAQNLHGDYKNQVLKILLIGLNYSDVSTEYKTLRSQYVEKGKSTGKFMILKLYN